MSPIEPLVTYVHVTPAQLADASAVAIAVRRGLRWIFEPRPDPSLRERLIGWQTFSDDDGSWRERVSWRAELRQGRVTILRRLSWRRWVHDHVVGTREWCE